MIITVDSSQATNKSSALLNKQYGLVETISSATAISRNSYSFADDISDDEPEIKRITFLGHADKLGKFGQFQSPDAFVDFLIRLLDAPENAPYLQNLETIDLFGCEIGHIQNGNSFVTQVAQRLSQIRPDLKIRAFSHRETESYEQTLLQDDDEWAYYGLNSSQLEEYRDFKKALQYVADKRDTISSLIASKTKDLREKKEELTGLLSQNDGIHLEVAPEAILEIEKKLHETQSYISVLNTQLGELRIKLDESRTQSKNAATNLRGFLQGTSILVPATRTPRETLDELTYCCFDSASRQLHLETSPISHASDKIKAIPTENQSDIHSSTPNNNDIPSESVGARICRSFKDCYRSIVRNCCPGTTDVSEDSAQNEEEREPLLPKSNRHKK